MNMDNINYYTLISQLSRDLAADTKIIFEENEIRQPPPPATDLHNSWPAAIQQFYKEMNGAAIQWRHASFAEPYICGKINLQTAAAVSAAGKGLIWFDHTPADSSLRKYKPIDFFADEAVVGFIDDNSSAGEMYLYLFEAAPIPLNVDFEGYIKLMVKARGYFYWQQVLVAIQQGKENQESTDFKTYMPQIFPGFSYDEFITLYRSVSINKQ